MTGSPFTATNKLSPALCCVSQGPALLADDCDDGVPERYLPHAIHRSGALDGFTPIAELTEEYTVATMDDDDMLLAMCNGACFVARRAPTCYSPRLNCSVL